MASCKKRTSPVWEFFKEPIVRVENGKSVKKIPCKLCDQLLSDGGGTTNLMNHLQAKHPEEHKRIKPSTSEPCSLKQATFTRGMLRKCSAQRSSAITDLLVEFVARDLRPLSVVEGKGFKKLVEYLEPFYRLSSHTHITSVCHRKFQLLKENSLVTLSNVDNVGVVKYPSDIRYNFNRITGCLKGIFVSALFSGLQLYVRYGR